MTEPANSWLAARETVDRRCRSAELAMQFAAMATADVQMVDLGCGTGANYRYLAPRMKPDVTWLAIDHDAEILESASRSLPTESVQIQRRDLASDFSVFSECPTSAFTASAFLDLVSEAWIRRFVDFVHDRPLLIAMTSTGLPIWDPVDEWDSVINECLERHQRSDHGFGNALGPDAVACLAEQLVGKGSDPKLRSTDWKLSADDTPLMKMLIAGIARRVRCDPGSVAIDEWEERRFEQLDRAELQLTWPHQDLLSVP
ncbi:Trans-aconitate 2-methyltransferase [Rubripirellula lacrimiformis]|uniref:Trans-aconitate 2-methyltransferase n=1 Tax=Rubripirellula lacrimiformis TaxID=1930273 RepID=A0A517NCW5_9BACT|nr:methyltransferase domain-containing protein [Rubripirellula lacrimiformis]QDT04951.1 Trans-aconitate 2-methyltransferase [Rubripirellula lacrimiformis]